MKMSFLNDLSLGRPKTRKTTSVLKEIETNKVKKTNMLFNETSQYTLYTFSINISF